MNHVDTFRLLDKLVSGAIAHGIPFNNVLDTLLGTWLKAVMLGGMSRAEVLKFVGRCYDEIEKEPLACEVDPNAN